MSDGTRIAVHSFLPRNGERCHPSLLLHDRYHSVARLGTGEAGRRLLEWLEGLVGRGYGVTIADARGSGASFGTSSGPFSLAERGDVYELVEWLAAQPWSTGRVGMIGRSYSGTMQYFAAAAAAPHLAAVFTEMALGQLYDFAYPGGIFRHQFAEQWGRTVKELDRSAPAIGVDADANGALLTAARDQHGANRSVYELFAALPFRDSRDPVDGSQVYLDRSPFSYRQAIASSKVAICHLSGWLDIWSRDAGLWFRNLGTTPQQLVIGPWAHGGGVGDELARLQDAWFSCWLSDETTPESPVRESPVRISTMRLQASPRWETYATWPPPGTRDLSLYLAEGRSRTVASCNDGRLLPVAANEECADPYTVDYATSSGALSRWANGYGGDCQYRDMTRNDERGLTYTTQPAQCDVHVVGHPILELHLSGDASDCDVFAYLEYVEPDGLSTYITEGALRASHRATAVPDFDNLDLPYHPSGAVDLEYGLRAPVTLVLDLLPTSFVIDAGHRLRLTLTGADQDNALTVRTWPPPRVRVHRGAGRRSCLRLPAFSPLERPFAELSGVLG